MSRRALLRPLTGLALIMLMASCQAPAAAPAATAPAMPAEPTPPPPEHRIGVRVVAGVGEFYDRATGDRFVPRGNNYVRLAAQQAPSGETIQYHSTFNVGLYDAARAGEALRRMRAQGYNTTRVFLNGCCLADSLGDAAGGLSSAYIENLVDFLRQAEAAGIYVIITTDGIPPVGGYAEILNSTWSADFAGNSAIYLRAGGIGAEGQLWRDLIEALISQRAPLDAILAYELRNEVFFDSNLPPLSLTSGTVQTANGNAYDMASGDGKQRMMDEGLVYWIDALRAEILKVDPSALVTVGFFPPDKPNPWPSAPRLIRTYPAIWQSSADFFDLHPYPGGYGLDKLVENYEMAGMEEKPIVMGEFGVARSSYASEAAVARALHDWEVESCRHGFDGWLLWTWDTEEQVEFYNGLTGKGLIDQVLAPAVRPDPCQAGKFDFFEYNLALGKPAEASRSLPDQPPAGAVDGRTASWWGAGDFAPQWVQIDLGAPSTIRLVRLVVTQSPAGDTRHELWVGASPEELSLLHAFVGYTVDGQVLEFRPDAPVENVRFIRVATPKSPSWVGWQEIEVLAPSAKPG